MAQAVQLPQDLASAHQLIIQLHARLHEMQSEIVNLEYRLDVMARRLFGRRREQLDPAQLELAFAALKAEEELTKVEVEVQPPDEPEQDRPQQARRGHGRRRLSKDLPREVRVLEPENTACPCCGNPMTKIGEDRSEQLHYVPATLKVIETVRPSYACGSCKEGIVTAPVPDTPITRGKATASLLAHVAVSKYADHLPLHRQVGILARQGAELSKQTLGGWVRQVYDLLAPVEAAHWESILSSHVLQADETPVKVLDPPRKHCARGYLWVYVGDQGEVAFDFSMGRGSEAPLKALSGFRGTFLQTDAYSGYGPVERANPLIERAGCMAHMRRNFYDARALDPPRCLLAMARVGQLYEIEREAKRKTSSRDELVRLRYVLRQERSVSVMEQIHEDLTKWNVEVLPKSAVGGAITYAINQWPALELFLTDGEIEIDNNRAERALRTVAVGRSNWTFCGSESGGAWAARIYGLLGTCRLLEINPHVWLTDVLQRVSSQRPSAMHLLTPRGWKQAREADAEGASPLGGPPPPPLG